MNVHNFSLSIGCCSLQEELAVNVYNEQINWLCKSEATSYQILPFTSARVLDPFLGQLWMFWRVFPTKLFRTLWRTQLEAHRKDHTLTFNNVTRKIWTPVFKQCTVIHEQLISSKISLAQVDQFFKQYSKNERALKIEIKYLHKAVQKCLEQDPTNLNWIEGIIIKMQQHWELSTYTDAACAFVKMRDTLQLTGDFSVVERVAVKVDI